MGLAVFIMAGVVYMAGLPFLELMQLKVEDALFLARGPLKDQSGKVVVVSIGERSLDEQGRWPWSRGKMARLIDKIKNQGAACIGLDMGFFEPEQAIPLEAVVQMAQDAAQGKPIDLEKILMENHPDLVLAQAMARPPCDVVLGFFFHTDKRDVAYLSDEEVSERRARIAKYAFKQVAYQSEAAMDHAPVFSCYVPENNQPVMEAATNFAGYYNVRPDVDGSVRRLALAARCGDLYYPSLSLGMLARLQGLPLPRIYVSEYGLDEIRLGDVTIPVDQEGMLRVRYLGGVAAMPDVEATDILEGRELPHDFKGKAVLINVSAMGVHDRLPTPFNRQLPGAMIHAQTMDNILSGNFLVRTPMMTFWDLGAMLALCLLGAWLMSLGRPWLAAGLTVLLWFGALYAGYRLFIAGYLVNLIFPLGALFLTAVAVTAYRYLVEAREKRQVRKTFQHYLSPAVIEQIMDNPDQLKLGGERKELSVLFVDIRGFTTLAEGMDPVDLASLLNAFTDGMTEVILEHGGLVDKYIGDSVMAVFGAPVDQPDHALRACRAALAMVAKVAELNRELPQAQGRNLAVGVGVNSGPMVVGNMGSRLRFDYTVIGDNVNLASRLEGQTREYGVEIIVSKTTREMCGDDLQFRILDLIRVKGKNEPVAIYELVAEARADVPVCAGQYAQAFSRYQDRNFGDALSILQGLEQDGHSDTACRLLADRCRAYSQTPPPDDWDGVETKSTK